MKVRCKSIGVFYTEPEKLADWIKDTIAMYDVVSYTEQVGKCLLVKVKDGGGFISYNEYFFYKYQQESKYWAAQRVAGCEFYYVRFLDGVFNAYDIEFILSRCRMGEYEVEEDEYNGYWNE